MVIQKEFYIDLIFQSQYYQADSIFYAERTKIGINIKFQVASRYLYSSSQQFSLFECYFIASITFNIIIKH